MSCEGSSLTANLLLRCGLAFHSSEGAFPGHEQIEEEKFLIQYLRTPASEIDFFILDGKTATI